MPTSGEGGSIEYWDISNLGDNARTLMMMLAYAVKGVAMGTKGVFTTVSYLMVNGSQQDVEAVVIDPLLALVVGEISETVEQSLISAGVDTTSIPRITKEEFYTI